MYEFDMSDQFWTKFNLRVRLPFFFDKALSLICFKILENIDSIYVDDVLHTSVSVHTTPTEDSSKRIDVSIYRPDGIATISIMRGLCKEQHTEGTISISVVYDDVMSSYRDLYVLEHNDVRVLDGVLEDMGRVYRSKVA